MSDFGELILKISERKDLESDLKSNEEKIKNILSKIDLKKIKEDKYCDYHTLKPIMKNIRSMIPDDRKGEFNRLLRCKKIESYPELKKATYFPEINQLNIPDSEKVRIDEAARVNCRYYITANNLSRLEYKLSIEDLEMLEAVGVTEKKYGARCKCCGDQIAWITQYEFNHYKKYFELLARNNLTEEEEKEADELCSDGFYELYAYCDDCESEICINDLKEFNELHFDIVYKVIKQPDLSYEKI